MLLSKLYINKNIKKIKFKVKYHKPKLINAAIKIYYFFLLLLDNHITI